MRVELDLDRCESNGLCMAAAPDVFLLDDNDDVHLLVAEPGEDRREAVMAAARVCPKQAITVID